MSLFLKKKEETACSSSCGCDCSEAKTENTAINACCGEQVNGICCIKVLGSGCKNCHALLENTQKAISNMGLSVEVEYVTDMEKIMEYGAMSMPVLVVNEKVVSMGKVLKSAEAEKLLQTYLV